MYEKDCKDNYCHSNSSYSNSYNNDNSEIFCYKPTPTADAGHDLYVDPGQPVIFNGISYDTDGKIVLEEWDFDGDGKFDWNSTATSSPPTYTFLSLIGVTWQFTE